MVVLVILMSQIVCQVHILQASFLIVNAVNKYALRMAAAFRWPHMYMIACVVLWNVIVLGVVCRVFDSWWGWQHTACLNLHSIIQFDRWSDTLQCDCCG